MKLYAIRHGETDWNVAKIAQGRTDIELNQNGISQAMMAKEKVQKLSVDFIISSPLKRAAKTAEILADNKLNVIFDERLKERSFGDIEGNRLESIDFDKIYNTELNLSIMNIEPVNTMLKRVNSFLSDIKSKYNDKTILIVAHGGILRALNACVNGIPASKTIESQGYKNCEIREFNI